MIRAIKPLRWFKIARIMKLGKAGPIIHLLMDYWNITPKQGKWAKAAFMLVLSVHILACLWWLSKVAFLSIDEVNAWLDAQPWKDGYQRAELTTRQGKLEAYVISTYLVTMTLTTVGYGDISAESTWERICYTHFFIVAAFLWANLLAEIGEIHQTSSAAEQMRMKKVQETLEFLTEHDCPRKLRTEIIQWTRFQEDHDQLHGMKKTIIASLPPSLQKSLVRHLFGRELMRVPVFAYIESLHDRELAADARQENFISEVLLALNYKTYTPFEVVINFQNAADRLIYIVSGRAEVQFEHPLHSYDPMTLKEDDFIGDMAILGDDEWSHSTLLSKTNVGSERTEIKMTCQSEYVVVLELTKNSFQDKLREASLVTAAAVEDFRTKRSSKMQRVREARAIAADEQHRDGKLQAVFAWEVVTLRLLRNNWEADPQSGGASSGWKFVWHTPALLKARRWRNSINGIAGFEATAESDEAGLLSTQSEPRSNVTTVTLPAPPPYADVPVTQAGRIDEIIKQALSGSGQLHQSGFERLQRPVACVLAVESAVSLCQGYAKARHSGSPWLGLTWRLHTH